jgi:hypothetical protein
MPLPESGLAFAGGFGKRRLASRQLVGTFFGSAEDVGALVVELALPAGHDARRQTVPLSNGLRAIPLSKRTFETRFVRFAAHHLATGATIDLIGNKE